MGTTESIFWSEEAPPSPSSLDGRVLAQHPPSQQQQHVRHNGGVHVQQHRQRSRKPHPRFVPSVDVLKGIILGLPNSGKRTLLQRLQGKDPFDQDLVESHPLPVHAQATAPYKPPPDAKTSCRIMLDVQIPHALEDKADFAVVLINPRHDPKHVGPYMNNVITSLLLQAGYPPPTQPHGKKEPKKSKQLPTPEPFCLCLLLNFRDLALRAHEQLLPQIQESELRQAAFELLSRYPSSVRKRIVLTCATTSLLNCYGLGVLHQFIYDAYLQYKQVHLEQQLVNIRQEVKERRSIQHKEEEGVSQNQDYNDYVKMLKSNVHATATPSVAHNSNTQQQHPDEADSPSAASARANDSRGHAHDTLQVDAASKVEQNEEPPRHDDESPKSEPQRQGRRRIMDRAPVASRSQPNTKKNKSKNMQDQKSALEAFLAEEEEDDDVTLSSREQKAKAVSHDSDDSDEDDYYYDEGGTRRGTHIMESDSDDSDEEQAPEHPATRPKAKKQQELRMPSISESPEQSHEDEEEEVAENNSDSDTHDAPASDDRDVTPDLDTDAVPREEKHSADPPPDEENREEQAEPDADLEDNHSETEPEDGSTDGSGREGDDSSSETEPVEQEKAAEAPSTTKEKEDEQEMSKTESDQNATAQDDKASSPGHVDSDTEEEADAGNIGRTKPRSQSESGDDDYMVEETTANGPEQSHSPPASAADSAAPQKHPSPAAASDMSSAAVAAIEAAQQEAELMLQQQLQQRAQEDDESSKEHVREKKAKKKKKDKKKKKEDSGEKSEKKKKKKRDKERRSKSSQESSD